MLNVWRQEKKKDGGVFGVMDFVFPSHSKMWWIPAFLGMVGHLPALGKGFWDLLCLWMWLLLCPLNCLHLNPQILSFSLSNSLPNSTVGDWVGTGWVQLLAGAKPHSKQDLAWPCHSNFAEKKAPNITISDYWPTKPTEHRGLLMCFNR